MYRVLTHTNETGLTKIETAYKKVARRQAQEYKADGFSVVMQTIDNNGYITNEVTF